MRVGATAKDRKAYMQRHAALGLCSRCPRRKTLYATRCNLCPDEAEKTLSEAQALEAMA